MTSIVAKTVKFATRTIKQYASRTFRVQPIITKSSTFQISQLRQYLWYYSVTQDYNDEAEDQEYPWGYRWQSQDQARYKLGSKYLKKYTTKILNLLEEDDNHTPYGISVIPKGVRPRERSPAGFRWPFSYHYGRMVCFTFPLEYIISMKLTAPLPRQSQRIVSNTSRGMAHAAVTSGTSSYVFP